MNTANFSETAATRFLRAQKVIFTPHIYAYEEKGGTSVSSRELNVVEHAIIKTLVMEDEVKNPLIILMHGDCQVSTKALSRQINCKKIAPCSPENAHRHTGYFVGGISPFGAKSLFGAKKTLPIYIEKTIIDLPEIYINGGKHGFLVSLNPQELLRVFSPAPILVNVANAS